LIIRAPANARVSTDGQTLDAQQASLKAAGAERVYSENISGTVTDRRQLQRAGLVHGDHWDEIVVHQDKDHKHRGNHHDPRRDITNNP
jgi:DNA invertase Pin-like site-specific DNA recombinase